MAWSWPAFPVSFATKVGPFDLGGDTPGRMQDPHTPAQPLQGPLAFPESPSGLTF